MLMYHLRHTLRLLSRSPGFTATAMATLALGIGANTAVFSVVDAVLLRPLPYPEPDRLVAVWESQAGQSTRSTVAPANLADYRRVGAFAAAAGHARRSMSLTKAGPPEQLIGVAVTWDFFATIGVPPALGRPFTADDDRPGGARVVVLSHDLWRARFAADPAILGRSITLDTEPYDVVGVMPEGFQAPSQGGSAVAISFFVPAAYPDELLANRGDHEIDVVARLRPGVPVERARAELRALSDELARRFPETNRSTAADLAPLRDDVVRDVRLSLVVMLGAVALVLLIACVNVANLLIVRAIGQRQEMAIRMALGASRGQLTGDLLMRGLVLGVLGGVAGLVCGVWTRDLLVSLAPAGIPRLDRLQLNLSVLGATAALSVLTGAAAGVVPALGLWRSASAPVLRETALTASGARSVTRWRGLLMASEIAAALVLAIGAGLLVRSLVRLASVELGFQTERVLALTVRLPESRYRDQPARAAFFADLQRRVQALAGVQSAAFANEFPMRGGWSSGFMTKGDSERSRIADFQAVSPGYFTTLGIPLDTGRLITDGDRAGAPRVAVVSRAFVRRFLTGNPIGQTIRRGPAAPAIAIVGVVGDVRRDGKLAGIDPQVYLAAAQTDVYPVRLAALAVRAAVEPHALVPAIQRAVWAIDPDQPITNVRTLDEVVSGSLARRRFNMLLLSTLAAIALGLSLVGVYGVVAHAAAQRTREIGIRVALGATRGDVVRLIVAGGLRWALGGIAAGVVLSFALTRFMTSLLFDLTPTDPATFAGIVALTFIVAAGASLVPALRASAADPVAAIRGD